MDAFYGLNPEDLLLVLHEGNIRLFDPSLREPLTAAGLLKGEFRPTKPGGKYVSGDLPGLMAGDPALLPRNSIPGNPIAPPVIPPVIPGLYQRIGLPLAFLMEKM